VGSEQLAGGDSLNYLSRVIAQGWEGWLASAKVSYHSTNALIERVQEIAKAWALNVREDQSPKTKDQIAKFKVQSSKFIGS